VKSKQDYTDAELRKAFSRALKKTTALAKMEPTVVLIADSSENETDQPLDEIAAWLFRRREDNDHSGNNVNN
jgi:hypothetical protein